MSVGMGITSEDARKSFDKLNTIVNKHDNNKDKKEKQKFEGKSNMENKKNIKITNLDELQKLLSDSQKLVSELQRKINKINNWQPKYKEKEEDKIDILDKYMKSLDERLFIREDGNKIALCFYDNDCGHILCWFDSITGFTYPGIGFASEKLYNELLKYKYAFKGKYEELYKGE